MIVLIKILIKARIVLCVLLQAPLTTKDTAVLSGSLSTHNGNGGGTINLALRRVTSAKGWGEVRCILTGHHTHSVRNAYYKWHTFFLCLCLSQNSCLPVWCNMQWHFKMWNIVCVCVCVYTGRAWCWRHPWTSLWNEDLPKLDASIVCVEMQEKINKYSVFYHYNVNNSVMFLVLSFSPQLCDRSVRAPVFIPRRASWGYHSAGPSPRQEHYGLSAVALGDPVFYEHQHSQGHQEQPFLLRNAG